MSIQSRHRCHRCGSLLSAGAPENLCPTCLLAEGLRPPPDEPEPEALPLGTVRYFGDYELLEQIGRGGMGVVYKARQVSLNRPVALKMILAGQLATETERQRFYAEAEAAATLDHPHIVAIYEVGEHAGQAYFSMQWVCGRSLARAVQGQSAGETLLETPADIARFMAKVARAVHYAHQRGILHRDLKPGNILIDSASEPHVTDFGLAKRVIGGDDLTVSGAILGTPSFMAPEQAAGHARALTTATDVYSLGAVLYYLLTGQPPFAAEGALETLRLVLEREPVRPGALVKGLDRDLETICLKCLQKDSQQRYASAYGLAEDLEHWCRHEPIRARPARAWEQAYKWAQRNPALTALAVVVLLVAMLGLAGVLWHAHKAETARRLAESQGQRATNELFTSYLAQAKAHRLSGQAGRRFEALKTVAKAAAIRPSLELRNEAIACLAVPDVRIEQQWQGAGRSGAAFDSRVERFACADQDGWISVRAVNDQRELMVLAGPSPVTDVRLFFSPDDQLLAGTFVSSTDASLRVWNLARNQLAFSAPLRVSRFAVAFSADNKTLGAAEADGTIHFYDLQRCAEARSIAGLEVPNCIAFRPGHGALAVCSERSPQVLVLQLENGAVLQRWKHPAEVHGLSWSHDGRLLACACHDDRIYLWDPDRPAQPWTVLDGHLSEALGAVFSPDDDLLASYGWDGNTRFWDVVTGRLLVSMDGNYIAPFSRSGERLAFAGVESEGIWRVEHAVECRRLGLSTFDLAGNAAGFSHDDRFLTLANPEGIRVWALETGRMVGQLALTQACSAWFSPDQSHLLTTGPAGIQQWPLGLDAATGAMRIGPATKLEAAAVAQSCLSYEGGLLVALREDSEDLIVLRRPQPQGTVSGRPNAAWGLLALSPDGRVAAAGNWKGDGVMLWDMETRKVSRTLPAGANVSVAFSPDGCWLVTGSSQEYCLWRTDAWGRGPAWKREQAGDIPGAMAFSPDGATLALAHGRFGRVKLVSVPGLEELATLESGVPLCFSHDGRKLAALSLDLRTLLVWDLPLIRQQLKALALDWETPTPLAEK